MFSLGSPHVTDASQVNVWGSSTSKANSKSDSCHKVHHAPVRKTTAHGKNGASRQN